MDYESLLEKDWHLREGERLFRFDESKGDVEGHKIETLRWYAYAESFKNAADHLVEFLRWNPGHFVYVLVFPAIYNYRQFLEILLKDLLRKVCNLRNERFPPETIKGKMHDLVGLFEELDWRFKDSFPEEKSIYWDRLRGVLEEFASWDPKGVLFRYPDQEKMREEYGQLPNLDIQNFKQVMEKIGCSFDGADTVIQSRIDYEKYGVC